MEEEHHHEFVTSWMNRFGDSLPPERLIRIFDHALGAIWQRCRVTLGEATLGAIVDRVLHDASEKFPLLASLKVESNGVCLDHLRENACTVDGDQLAEGVRFVLVHFLRLLGSLTAEILTPALQAELSRIALDESPELCTAPADKPGEDVTS